MFKIDTYRDGGTVSVLNKTTNQEFFINRMLRAENFGAVFKCYPTKGVPINTEEELLLAEQILTEALPSFSSPDQIIAIGIGISWIQTRLYYLKNKDT